MKLVALALAALLACACSMQARPGATAGPFVHRAACEPPVISRQISNLIAASDLVVVAKPQVREQELLGAAALPHPDYVDVRLAAVEPLKGEAPAGDLLLKVYPRDRPYAPSSAALVAASDSPSLLFLTRVDEGPAGLYFAGYTPAALRSAREEDVAAVRAEVARQRRLLDAWRPDPALSHFAEVRTLIDQLAGLESAGRKELARSDQAAIFRRLEQLGESAVPAIVAQLDDRRPLAFGEISLVNRSPDAFEALRHYNPRLIVDALAAILNQITGERFGSIQSGGSERERRSAVEGWRVYAANLRCSEMPGAAADRGRS